MIPQRDVDISSDLPAGTAFWMPRREDMSEEGFSYFRDSWLILDVPPDIAVIIIDFDVRIALTIETMSPDASVFEKYALAIEEERFEDIPGDPFANFPEYAIEGLELGVSGLAHALAAIGCAPAASCRSHEGPDSWSPCPAIEFACDRERFEWLQPLVRDSGCGFSIDPARSELLMIIAPSIRGTLDLAKAIISSYATQNPVFPEPPWRESEPSGAGDPIPHVDGQISLW
ncbi:hypothetical protein [Streptomyces mirabilis]|uniref:hypothetical protein n=1 Tax=Streptomyces mirabilis TaxID=68239 RepID=UPI00331F40BD